MGAAKDILIRPLQSKQANDFIRRRHYSGKVVQNSQLHFGVFLHGRLEGAMSFGPSLDKRKLLPLVDGTGWNEFIELNRLAFSDTLPRNSESRALAVVFRMMRRHAPHLKWVVSFADATQCGDGTIYRASGFVLTGIKENQQLYRLPFADDLNIAYLKQQGLSDRDIRNIQAWLISITPNGRQDVAHKLSVEDRSPNKMSLQGAPHAHKMSLEGAPHAHKMSLEGGHRPSQLLSEVKKIMRRVTSGATSADRLFRLIGGEPASGFQLRYIYFLNKACRARLTVDEIPFSEIENTGASMYRGQSMRAADGS